MLRWVRLKMSPSQLFLTSPLFSVDSTPAASRRSASGLASFSGDPRACAISWPGLLDLPKCLSLGLDACSVSWLWLWPRLFFWVDSTPAASRRSASGLASFADVPGACGISWPGLLDLPKCFSLGLDARPLASPLFLSGLDACGVSWLGLRPRFFFGWPRCLRHFMAWPFGLVEPRKNTGRYKAEPSLWPRFFFQLEWRCSWPLPAHRWESPLRITVQQSRPAQYMSHRHFTSIPEARWSRPAAPPHPSSHRLCRLWHSLGTSSHNSLPHMANKVFTSIPAPGWPRRPIRLVARPAASPNSSYRLPRWLRHLATPRAHQLCTAIPQCFQ